jgi:protein-tyrosine-phosphatase
MTGMTGMRPYDDQQEDRDMLVATWIEEARESVDQQIANHNHQPRGGSPKGHRVSVGLMERVLCVCVGNISRSPMMQAVLQQHLGAFFLVESAGMSKELAGRPANARSVACMAERGVDLSGHISRWIGDLDLDQYRWIVCVGHDEANKVRSALGADSAASVLVP